MSDNLSDEPDLRGFRACVIGASGFVGRHTTSALQAAGAKVTCVSRQAPLHDVGDARWIVGDVQHKDTVLNAIVGADAVIYLASSSLPTSANADMAGDVQKHVFHPVRVAEFAVSMGVRKFIFASSGGTIYGPGPSIPLTEDMPLRPLTAYAVSKLAVEEYLKVMRRLHDLGAVSLRITNPYGEFQTPERGQGFVSAAMRAAFQGSPLRIWGDGSVVRDYIYVGDVAQAFIRASLYEGVESVFNIGTGVGRSLLDVVESVQAVTGRSIAVLSEPERAVDVPVNILDISRANQRLGWAPRTEFLTGLRRTAEWWTVESAALARS